MSNITELLDTIRARMGHDFSVTVHRDELEAIIVEHGRLSRPLVFTPPRYDEEFMRAMNQLNAQDANEVEI